MFRSLLKAMKGSERSIEGELSQFGRKGLRLMMYGWSKRYYVLSGSMLTCLAHKNRNNRVLWRGRVSSVSLNDEEKKEFIVWLTDDREIRLRGNKLSDVWYWIASLDEACLYRKVEDMLGWSQHRSRYGKRDRLDDEVTEVLEEIKLTNSQNCRYVVDHDSAVKFDSPFLIYSES